MYLTTIRQSLGWTLVSLFQFACGGRVGEETGEYVLQGTMAVFGNYDSTGDDCGLSNSPKGGQWSWSYSDDELSFFGGCILDLQATPSRLPLRQHDLECDIRGTQLVQVGLRSRTVTGLSVGGGRFSASWEDEILGTEGKIIRSCGTVQGRYRERLAAESATQRLFYRGEFAETRLSDDTVSCGSASQPWEASGYLEVTQERVLLEGFQCEVDREEEASLENPVLCLGDAGGHFPRMELTAFSLSENKESFAAEGRIFRAGVESCFSLSGQLSESSQ